MYIIQMKASHSICLAIVCMLITVCQASNGLGSMDAPTPFALMDLTELMRSLNTTYDELASSLQALNKTNTNQNPPEPNQVATETTQKPVPASSSSPLSSKPTTQTKQSQEKSSTQQKVPPPANSQTNYKSSQSSESSLTSSTQPSASPKPSTQTPTPTPLSTSTVASKPTQPAKPSLPSVQPPLVYSTTQPRASRPSSQNSQTTPTTPPKNSQTKPISTASNNVPQSKPQSSTQNKQSNQVQSIGNSKATTSQASTSSNSPLPTFGPGPTNKGLPPVIDLTKIIVDYSAINSTQSKPQTAPNNKNEAAQPTMNQASTKPATQRPNTQPQPQPAPPTPPVPVKSNQPQTFIDSDKPKQTSSDQSTAKNIVLPKPTIAQPQNNPNQVFLPPVATQPSVVVQPSNPSPIRQPATVISSPPKVDSLRSQADSSVEAYQCLLSNKNAMYSISPSYQAFANYFIMSDKDEYLSPIQSYLINNYGTYLSGGQVLAGFRVYNNYGDNSIDYQLLYLTNYGTFTAILTYSPDSGNIRLKSLSILNFFIMEITYPNCLQRDTDKQNCKVCSRGYRNFMGRCKPFDQFCSAYSTDECGECVSGKKLVQGVCQ